MPDRAGRLRRLAEELDESGLPNIATGALRDLLLDEIDHALRPTIHERRVPSSGAMIEPSTDASGWEAGTQLQITRRPLGAHPIDSARLFADGLSSWLVRRADGDDEWLVFDRPAGSERDLLVMADVLGTTIVQRHPSGAVRVAGGFGVLRWNGFSWHHEPPARGWIDVVTACADAGEIRVLEALVDFAVHDLGANGIGALLIYRPQHDGAPAVEERLPAPPPLRIDRPTHLAPLRHALAQVDGAAVFDRSGALVQLGVRLVPSEDAETTVDAFKGMRHTSARRYSYDDPTAVVLAVSEDGPVSVLVGGTVLGRSP